MSHFLLNDIKHPYCNNYWCKEDLFCGIHYPGKTHLLRMKHHSKTHHGNHQSCQEAYTSLTQSAIKQRQSLYLQRLRKCEPFLFMKQVFYSCCSCCSSSTGCSTCCTNSSSGLGKHTPFVPVSSG